MIAINPYRLVQLIPVLLLATVAFSTSNVLPTLAEELPKIKTYNYNGQSDDNTFSNNNQPNNILTDIFYTTETRLRPKQKDDKEGGENESYFKTSKDIFNDGSYRQNQWHNYPRQLDRLHSYNTQQKMAELKNVPMDNEIGQYNEKEYEDVNAPFENNKIETSDFIIGDNDKSYIYDTIASVENPFLVLKIRLAYMNADKNGENSGLTTKYFDVVLPESKVFDSDILKEAMPKYETDRNLFNADDKTGVSNLDKYELVSDDPGTIKSERRKRIFSLWSRLQSLSPKGHELHHRRHLYAFYGLPQEDGGLTAETRAMLRPPGSPLRWG